MGQQVAFIILIVLCGMIFTQILMLAKNEKTRYDNLMMEIEKIQNKIE